MFHDRQFFKRAAYTERATLRHETDRPITLQLMTGQPWTAGRLVNVSPLGAGVMTTTPLKPGSFVLIKLRHREPILAIVRWGSTGSFGVQFVRKLSTRSLKAMLPRRNLRLLNRASLLANLRAVCGAQAK